MTLSKTQIFYLILLLILIKVSFVSTFKYLVDQNYTNEWNQHTFLAHYSGDSHAYIKPIDNFIEYGEYYFDETTGREYAGRAPYYGSIYYVLRLAFGPYVALDMLAMLQIISECLAGYFMALIVLKITKANWSFWFTLLLFSLSWYQTEYSGRILTESFSNSALIFFAYRFLLLYESKTTKNYFISGFWLSIAVVLKPYFAPLFLLFFLQYNSQKTIIENFYSGLLFSLTLILIILPFTYRNYNQFGIIQPFTSVDAGSGLSKGDLVYRSYLQGLGESFVFWDPDCAGCLFTNIDVYCNYKLPSYAYTEATDSSSIMETRNLYIEYLNNKSPEREKAVIEKFEFLIDDFKKSHPFMYYIGSRFRLAKYFIFQKASYYIPNPFTGKTAILLNIVKGFQYVLYYFILFAGIIGITILINKKLKIAILLGFIPFYLVLFFAFIFRAIEWRYWSNAYCFLIMSASYAIYYLYEKYTSTSRIK